MKSSKNLSLKNKMELLYNDDCRSLKECDGFVMKLDAYILVENEDSKTLRIIGDGAFYATSSPSFIQSFEEILDECEAECESGEVKIKVVKKKSKNQGREYIVCRPVFQNIDAQ